jgi:hypothetical protein
LGLSWLVLFDVLTMASGVYWIRVTAETFATDHLIRF